VSAVFLLTGAFGGARPVEINGYGLWTLHRLGYPDEVRHDTKADLRRPRILYRLPPTASQGPRDWYLIRLHLRVVLNRTTGPGTLYVTSTTDAATCGLVELRVDRISGRRIDWTSSGIVNGIQHGHSRGRILELRYANYLQRAGVKGGINDLDFQLTRRGSLRVSEVRILDDSGIEFSRLGPAEVHLNAHLLSSRSVINVGHRFVVQFILSNEGERTSHRIHVGAAYSSSRVRLLRARGVEVASLRRDEASHGSFTFLARKPGRTTIFLSGDTSSNHPGDAVSVVIVR
jgi:hypothetical protein